MKKLLDFMAGVCLLFDVEWDKDFEDDEYVIAFREEKEGKPRITLIETGRAAAAS
ncbi:MAG: hypothetical protein K5911_04425 [Eubacteriales bacterium]|nr:hypothetical protein [Eubacteriales bacterium]